MEFRNTDFDGEYTIEKFKLVRDNEIQLQVRVPSRKRGIQINLSVSDVAKIFMTYFGYILSILDPPVEVPHCGYGLYPKGYNYSQGDKIGPDENIG